MLDTQVVIGRPLVDSEQKLMGVDSPQLGVETVHLRLTACQPACSPGNGFSGIIVWSGIFNTLIKGHGDGGTQVGLYLHTFLRPHENLFPIHMGRKMNPFLGDFPQGGQGKDLKATAVGKDGALPGGEFV